MRERPQTTKQIELSTCDLPVNVVISSLFLNFPHTGTGRYARHVIHALSQRDDLRCHAVSNRRNENVCDAPNRSANGSLRFVRAAVPGAKPDSQVEKLLWEQAALPIAAARLRADVLYAPHFSVPLVATCKTVVSIHDLIPLTDKLYAQSASARLYFKLVCAAAKRAAAVITLSRYAANEIGRLLNIEPRRVHIVPPGVDPLFKPMLDELTMQRVRETLILPRQYVLYIGGADARKNIGVLLEAADALRDHEHVPTLVIAAGMPKAGSESLFPDWRAHARRLGLGSRVQFIERIEEQDLPSVYRGALAFAFPSRAEGFGLTPLEAMACGTPVLCSNATSLPEAVGDAGILLDPDDASGWAAAILRICSDAGLRAKLGEAGVARAAQFQWSATGARVGDILREVAACAS